MMRISWETATALDVMGYPIWMADDLAEARANHRLAEVGR